MGATNVDERTIGTEGGERVGIREVGWFHARGELKEAHCVGEALGAMGVFFNLEIGGERGVKSYVVALLNY